MDVLFGEVGIDGLELVLGELVEEPDGPTAGTAWSLGALGRLRRCQSTSKRVSGVKCLTEVKVGDVGADDIFSEVQVLVLFQLSCKVYG